MIPGPKAIANSQDSGLVGFFSGSSLRISRKAASSAIAWTVYEGLLLVFHSQQQASKAAQQKLA